MHTVGPKGQVVIAKEIRERLEVRPGWKVLQRIVGDHVELYFLPPSSHRSLKGVLAPYLKRTVRPEEWEKAKEEAWRSAVGRDG